MVLYQVGRYKAIKSNLIIFEFGIEREFHFQNSIGLEYFSHSSVLGLSQSDIDIGPISDKK